MTKPVAVADMKGHAPLYHLFLGGHDLEMVTIRELALAILAPGHVHDQGLRWGARASAYAHEIDAVLRDGATPVLIELIDDLDPAIDRNRLIIIDHHGKGAGVEKPCSLRQVFDLVGLPETAWSRRYGFVAANDVGHMRALREAGATPAEIRAIREADRSAQGVTAEDEAAAHRAIAAARRRGSLLVVEAQTARTSPILDFLEPEYGGPGTGDVLVLAPETVEFYGRGDVVQALARRRGSWYGGALPERGFWGLALKSRASRRRLAAEIEAHLDR